MEPQPVDPSAVGLLMYRAHRLARAEANRAAGPTGLELQHTGVLTAVREGGARSQRELGAALGIDKSTLVRIVDDLESRGLLLRRRAPTDRRAYEILITEEGERRLEEAAALFDDAMAGLLEVFTPEQQRQLRDLLARFVAQAPPGRD